MVGLSPSTSPSSQENPLGCIAMFTRLCMIRGRYRVAKCPHTEQDRRVVTIDYRQAVIDNNAQAPEGLDAAALAIGDGFDHVVLERIAVFVAVHTDGYNGVELVAQGAGCVDNR